MPSAHSAWCTTSSATSPNYPPHLGDGPFSLAITSDYDGLTITDSTLFLGPPPLVNT